MWYAKLKTDLLAARDGRQQALEQVLARGQEATLFLSLAIPGGNKRPPGTQRLFHWARQSLVAAYPQLLELRTGGDALGPYAILAGPVDPYQLKRGCVELEGSFATSRLLDADVYTANGVAVDREALQLGQRSCLICEAPAKECILLARHPYAELVRKTDELLRYFSD
jgi:holo-ACP synthase